MDQENANDLDRLQKRGTFQLVQGEEVPSDGKVLSGHFVLAIKATDYDMTVHIARLVGQRRRNRDECILLQSSSKTGPASVRLVVGIVAM